MAVPIAIAVAGTVWPPVTRGSGAFAAMVWLGHRRPALPPARRSPASSSNSRRSGRRRCCRRSRRPTRGSSPSRRPACSAGSASADGSAGRRALRRRRFADGALIGTVLTVVASTTLFVGAAVANELAVRDTVPTSSRFGPTDPGGEPPFCDGDLAAGPAARLALRPVGRPSTCARSATSTAAASGRATTSAGRPMSPRTGDSARPAPRGSATPRGGASPGGSWGRDLAGPGGRRRRSTCRCCRTALTPGQPRRRPRTAASTSSRARGHGAAESRSTGRPSRPRSRRSRWLVGDADLHRWRGELDYWVFADGQLGQVVGNASGEAIGIDPEHLLADVVVHLTATERDRDLVVYPPAP